MTGSLDAAVKGYAAGLADRVAAAVAAGRALVPTLAERLAANGLTTDESLRDGLATLPILSKDDVLALQQADPPFGGALSPSAHVRRVFQSPGPIYEPQLDGADPWRWGPSLQAAGMGAEDLVLNCFGYHLSPAGAMFEEAALALGARVLPGGIGNQDLQARAVADLGVTAYTGLPSYLKAILDRYDELGLPRERWRLHRALVTAEPLPDSLRALLLERVPTVLMAYGTAETGLIGYETEPGGGLVPAPGVLVQICDLDTGAPITEGEGQVVVTLLRPDYPMVRFGTGDLSAWRLGPDGSPRLVGVLGRSGAAVKVRGMFLHPRQAAAVLAGVADVQQWRFVIDRVDHRDELGCEVVVRPGVDASAVVADVTERVRSGLRFSCAVSAVESLPDDAAPITDRRDWA
ncbi:MAG: AMP-binding protein [Actinomycetales bacterium]|jgi:phenylacetate-CoA ligase|nr:AMP-binding protein [Candidatus Phosphoribacter baldrii]MBK6956045.1 AMP-binding protein [Candidatus Phosphoribacter baldrii]